MFKLSYICDLLEKLQHLAHHDPPYNSKELQQRSINELVNWFKAHRKTIDTLDAEESAAFLSTLLPQRRKDRVYGIQSPTLVKLLGRCLALNISRRADLTRYKDAGNGDLGDCLERVLRGGGPPALPPVSLLEVDELFQFLAGQCRFSSVDVQELPASSGDRDEKLRHILLRSSPAEAKWVVRLILKDLSPAVMEESLVQRLFHFLISDLLNMHNDFGAATRVLKETFKGYPSQPDPQSRVILRQTAAASMRPIPGLMIARSEFYKARSIQQCLQMTAGRRWLVDRKYDGEYCQIHIDLSKDDDWIKIYSKSGRDSTQDRQGLHDTIQRCLRIGTDKCQIKNQCILIGEMVVYNDTDKCIVSFDNIRKHVRRAGVFLGADQDSPALPNENLMIVFFDLLLLDEENLLNQPIEKRRAQLSRLYKKLDGRAQTAESLVIDFGRPGSERKLMHQFAASNALRHEGLVLKPCDVPYFSLPPPSIGDANPYCPKMIKLKKDYIVGLGDEADFAVIGASYNAQEANKKPELAITWTHFHLGCLMNETDVDQYQTDPIFKFVGTITMDQCIPVAILQQINAEGKFFAEAPASCFTVKADAGFRPDVYFRKPFVFEVLGSSYSRPSNSGFYMLRHPRVKRLHSDRTWRECITFDQLQNAAQEALTVPMDSETQENLDWMERLEASCKRKFAEISHNTTPASAKSVPTPRSMSRLRKRKFSALDTPSIHVDVDVVPSSPTSPCFSRPVSRPQKSSTQVLGQKPFLPTPPTSSPLRDKAGGTPSSSRKRPTASTSQTYQKKACQGSARCPPEQAPRPLRPLTDVTNHAVRDAASVQTCQENSDSLCRALDPVAARVTQHATVPPEDAFNKSRRGSTVEGLPAMHDERPILHLHTDTAEHIKKAFLFDRTIVYVDQGVQPNANTVRQRLSQEGIAVVEKLRHWERDSSTHARLSDTVSESQSYPGSTKIALVDSEHAGRLCAAVSRILGLNGGGLREEILIYDYRIKDMLSSCRRRSQSHENDEHGEVGSGSGRWFVGTVVYDEDQDHSVFRPSNIGSGADTEGRSCKYYCDQDFLVAVSESD